MADTEVEQLNETDLSKFPINYLFVLAYLSNF